jgi:cytochrome c-type biogenesis protein CcmH
MLRLKNSLLIVLVTVISVAQTASNLENAVVERVGSKLACLCGTCNNTVANCPMLECHYSKPARGQIAELAAAGKSDKEIIDFFVKREGLRALAEPPAEGFNLMGRVMPFLALAIGLWITWFFLQRFRRKPAPAAGPVADDATLSRYQERMDKDLEKLD